MSYQRIIDRIRGEYLEMPGLQLNQRQAERLCGIDASHCKAILDALVDASFLVVNSAGVYSRATEGAPLRARPGLRRHIMSIHISKPRPDKWLQVQADVAWHTPCNSSVHESLARQSLSSRRELGRHRCELRTLLGTRNQGGTLLIRQS